MSPYLFSQLFYPHPNRFVLLIFISLHGSSRNVFFFGWEVNWNYEKKSEEIISTGFEDIFRVHSPPNQSSCCLAPHIQLASYRFRKGKQILAGKVFPLSKCHTKTYDSVAFLVQVKSIFSLGYWRVEFSDKTARERVKKSSQNPFNYQEQMTGLGINWITAAAQLMLTVVFRDIFISFQGRN